MNLESMAYVAKAITDGRPQPTLTTQMLDVHLAKPKPKH